MTENTTSNSDKVTEWQPIYTVPKDRKVWVTDGSGSYWAAKFFYYDEDSKRIYFEHFHGDYTSGPEDPIMWRDLEEIKVAYEDAEKILQDVGKYFRATA